MSKKENYTTTEADAFERDITEVAMEYVKFLVDKNRKYGDSVLNPVRAFSKADPEEQIKVRMDDKISRLLSGQSDDTEDPIDDLVGYRLIQKVMRLREHRSQVSPREALKRADEAVSGPGSAEVTIMARMDLDDH